MSCHRAYQIDLPGFLEDASGPAFADFRAHYPGCDVCAAEVRAWTELDLQLRSAAAGGAAHPGPEQLAAYARDAQALAPGERGGLDAHLARCRACRDELAALRAFLASGVPAASGAADTAAQGTAARWLATLRGLLWQPAFAYALLAAVLVPALYRTLGPGGAADRDLAVVLREEAVAREDRATVRAERPQPGTPPRPSGEAARDTAQAPPPEPGAEPLADLRLEQLRAHGYRVRESDAAVASDPAPEAAAKSQAPPLGRQAAGRAPTAARSAVPVVTLRPDAVVEVRRPSGPEALRLRIPVGERAPGARVEVVVTNPSGARELRERHTLGDAARALEVVVPVAWLTRGSHRVRVVWDGEAEPGTFAFDVMPASGS